MGSCTTGPPFNMLLVVSECLQWQGQKAVEISHRNPSLCVWCHISTGWQFLCAFAKLRKTTIMSVCCLAEWNNLDPTGRILMKFYTCGLIENLSRNFQFHLNLTRKPD